MENGKKVSVSAKIGKIINADRSGNSRIVLENVFVDDLFFRDHIWAIKTKRFNNISVGDTISASAIIVEYHGYYGNKKIGLKSFRNINVLHVD